jgi:hypothetical protein
VELRLPRIGEPAPHALVGLPRELALQSKSSNPETICISDSQD